MEQNQAQSNELIRWLQMLSLPLWTRIVLLTIMFCIVSGGLALVGYGMFEGDTEPIVSGVTLLTIATPFLLIVVALVFTPRGAKKLQEISRRFLQSDIQEAVLSHPHNCLNNLTLTSQVDGCVANYVITCTRTGFSLNFRLELNVYKVNLILWIPVSKFSLEATVDLAIIEALYGECLKGAVQEGYFLNPHLRTNDHSMPMHYGVILFKKLDTDFLLKPAQQLYFSQDLAFFLHSILAIELSTHHEK